MASRQHLRVTMAALVTGFRLSVIPFQPGQAEPLLEQQGTIAPAQATYSFDGKAGDVVAILLDSDDFDPVLSLLNSAQEEIATNDDFGGSLNSRIIFELPADGSYTVIARSFSGEGGNYSLLVRAATDYEMAYAEAEALVLAEKYEDAISAYSEAIQLDPAQAPAYLGRAQATLGQVYLEQGEAIEGPEDLPAEVRQAVIADFEQAATLLESEGDGDWAASLREQVEFLRSVEN
ncbi:MAG: hypothetical protein HC929_18270 [Leptolyngbyaceae cyanobacterium SM2_5_2]|nr:hypothetical protein [Leptolyngbyaceae cyanobacterium SM2_5_2]